MPGELSYLTCGKNQPQLTISNVLNQYFYKDNDPVASKDRMIREVKINHETGEAELAQELPVDKQLTWPSGASARYNIELKKSASFEQEQEIIDQLIEDVLPHGYA
jgi:hypothetical protein